MRVLAREEREGMVRLRPESLDDLWHLHHLVEPGDVAKAVTARRDEGADDKIRSEKREKRTLVLAVRVEEVEFQEHGDRLRIHGVIVDGPPEVPRGAHHTLLIEVMGDVTLYKADGLKAHHRGRIEEAVAAAKRPLVLILSLDDDEAYLAALRQYGVHELAVIHGRGRGKGNEDERDRDTARKAFFGETLQALRRERRGPEPLIVVGPGFTRDEFLAFAKERDREAIEGAVSEATGQSGRAGVQEALKRGVVERVQKESRVALETRWVEEVLVALATEKPVTYGVAHVERALDMGAVERLLVTDVLLRQGDGERLMERAEKGRAEAHVVSTAHDAGVKLSNLGGAAALLRFAL